MEMQPTAPFLWPEGRILTCDANYSTTPPSEQYLNDADLISGILVGANNGTIQWLQKLLAREGECRVCAVVVLFPAGPTREAHLRALQELQSTQKDPKRSLEIRVLPMSRSYGSDYERIVVPPTVVQANNSRTGHSMMSIGSTGDAGIDATIVGSFNAVFRPDDGLRDQWRRWFQFIFECAAPLAEATVAIPHLVPPEGHPKAAEMWAAFLKDCEGKTGEALALPKVDPANGEVLANAAGVAVKPWDDGKTALDPLARVLQEVYAKGWLVTVDEATRIKPLAIPVKATLLGQSSERKVGALTQKQSFTLQVFDAEVSKAVEKCRKVTDLLELLAFPLSSGNRWTPDTAKPLLDKEIEARNISGQQALIKALGGNEAKSIEVFIAAKKESIRKDLNEMYAQLGQGKEVPADKFEAVLKEVEERIKQALNARVTPRLVFNRIATPDLTGTAPDPNWSQPFSLLLRTAQAMRNALVDPYFPRKFSGLTFGEVEFRKNCDPFGDQMADSRDFARAKDELANLAATEAGDQPLKDKCNAVWRTIKGEAKQ